MNVIAIVVGALTRDNYSQVPRVCQHHELQAERLKHPEDWTLGFSSNPTESSEDLVLDSTLHMVDGDAYNFNKVCIL